MIEFKEGNYILGMWFAADKKGNDWMMCIQRKNDEPEKWFGDFRFRKRMDEYTWNSKDEKTWYSMKDCEKTEDEMIAYIDGYVRNVIATRFTNTDKLMIQGDLKKFMEVSKTAGKDWLQMRSFEVIKGGKE